jgi:hypothetical protein
LVLGCVPGRAATGDELAGAVASATATDLDGRPAGLVAAWRRGRKPLRSAGRVDERVIDPAGPPAWVSLVLVPPEVAAVRRPREAAICLHKTGRALGLPGRWRRLAAGSPEPALSHYWAEDRCGRRGGVA